MCLLCPALVWIEAIFNGTHLDCAKHPMLPGSVDLVLVYF